MNLTRCNQGHFFDADKYETCPHCNRSAGENQTDFDKTVAESSVANGGSSTYIDQTVPAAPPAPAAPAAPAPTPSAKNSTLKSQVDDVQKTVGIFKTEKSAKQPVAGWLVCVEGPHLGEDFRIVMGRNFVGRAGNMDIVLANDNMVSRDKHAIIVYDPKANLFIIQAGESKELFYLNDRVVLSPTDLKPYDVIKLGASKLLFVPFCSENFNWNEIEDNAD